MLLPAFERTHDAVSVKLIAVGSGEAMALGRRRDADVLLVHSPADEAQFMSDGHGRSRHVVMWNDYVLAGPSADPADVRSAPTITAALRRIAASGVQFISRGDSSGTHRRELDLWRRAGIGEPPHTEVGQGMGEALTIASERGAYTLVDRSTLLALSARLRLEVVFEGGPELVNPYSVITVAGSRHELAADMFAEWMRSADARDLIRNFGVERLGQPLFHPGAATNDVAPTGSVD